jgi:hypothetical protein
MHISTQSLRTIAWSTLAISAARAQYVIDNLSFGQKEGTYISPDLRSVPHFDVQGIDDYVPQVLSDRVILTPPYPGNKRGSIWAQDPLHHTGDWTAEVNFRASGMERGAGNLQIWYVRESQARETPTSLYTAPKFDGLVLVIDQYEGHGGSVRGFLNDGTIDIKSHPNPDTLSFGKCDYAYRNRGVITPIKLHHAEGFLEVIIDGESCFKTDKVRRTTPLTLTRHTYTTLDQTSRRLLLRCLCLLRRKPRLLRNPQIHRLNHKLAHARRTQQEPRCTPTNPPTTAKRSHWQSPRARNPPPTTTRLLNQPTRHPQDARRRDGRKHSIPTRPVRRSPQPHPNHE